MKVLLSLFVLSLVAGGIYCWGGNSLDERQVRAFYAQAEQALLEGDDEALCDMLADGYRQASVLKTEAGQIEQDVDKQRYCEEVAQTTKAMQQLREAMGGYSPIRYEQQIKRITLFEDGEQAKVEMTSTLDMAGMRLVSRNRDTIERRRWRTQLVSSVGVVHAGGTQ
jgi:methylphosphotriester-DNA--protein-cysteine methyltransferase